MRPQQSVSVLRATFTANGADNLIWDGDPAGVDFGRAVIDAGLFIDVGTTTSFDLTIVDRNGRSVYSDTGIAADVDQAASADGFQGPFTATVSNISGADQIEIYFYVRA